MTTWKLALAWRSRAMLPRMGVKGGGKTYHWAEKKCTTEIMADGSDLGVGLATGTVGRRSWEDYAPALAWSGPNLMRSLAESTW